MATKTLEREEILVDLLKESGTKGVKGSDIDTLFNITSKNRSNFLGKMMKKHPEIKNISENNHSGAIYAWVDFSNLKVDTGKKKVIKRGFKSETDIPFYVPLSGKEKLNALSKAIEANIESKNQEGYPDPTPAKAIEPKKQTKTPKAGEIWQTVESNGTNGYIFVLNSLNGAAQCIKLYANTTENQEIVGPNPFEVKVKGTTYIGDATHATFKPLRYCMRLASPSLPVKLKDARDRIADAFGIPAAIPEIIEKTDPEIVIENENLRAERKRLSDICEKLRVDVETLKKENQKLQERLTPPSKALENYDYVDQKSVQLAILTEQKSIWEEVARSFLNGVSSRENLPF